jgi:hypothetical protein
LRLIAPLLLAAGGAAAVVAVVEAAGGDFSGWSLWQAIAAPAAMFVLPAVLSALVARRNGVVEAIAWALACAGLQLALVFGVGFLVLGYGPT